MRRRKPPDFVNDCTERRDREYKRAERLCIGLLVAATVVIILLGQFGCAHGGNIDVARAKCDRDGGQWVVEYSNDGEQTRCACVHQRR